MAEDNFETIVDGLNINSGESPAVDFSSLVTIGGNVIQSWLNSGDNKDGSQNILNRHEIHIKQFSEKSEVRLSGLAGLFRGSLESVSVGVLQEQKKFTVANQKDSDDKYEFGVAVRLFAGFQSNGVDVRASIPEIAAQATLAQGKAAVLIKVEGFSGYLGDLLPPPGELNVETFSGYMTSFQEISKRVFGESGERFHVPTILSWSPGS